ncbi:T9SS-dependent M36 family metallopeptidase [Epilithonimonas sp. UC225_85]|uniref:T9SS-dependent M36 family metallopeptidase n=1 Tax=Epilithonimonas sp. UC225_85 TaxID=3350167 RepID=UPI0036D34AB0
MKLNKKISVRVTIAVTLFAFANVYSQNVEKELISDYLTVNSKASVKSFDIINTEDNTSLDGKVINIQQTFKGIPVYGAISSALVRNNKIAYVSDNFLSFDINKEASTRTVPTVDIPSSFPGILSALGLKADASKYIFTGKKDNTVLYKVFFYQKEDKSLNLDYVLNFYEYGTNNYWDVVVDAFTGKIIDKSNLTVSCNFSDHAFSQGNDLVESHSDHLVKKDSGIKMTSKSAASDASYRVFALPVEAPSFGSRTLETNPWYLDASPNGWQTDGTDTFSITRGNNAYAYTDIIGSNSFGYSADGGVNKVFDFPLDLSQDVTAYTDASVTNLFYMTNKMHDIFYRFGFNEAGRNFQAYNFGKGEPYTDEDPVLAEARDGAGTNNANFATPMDGYAPRMQMYLWNYGYLLSYNAPTDLVGRKPTAGYNVDFGGQFPTTTALTSDVVMASPLDACTDLSNTNLTGKIALIERGSCDFDDKFKRAQNKGAIAVIIYNPSQSQAIGNMGGDDSSVTIPGVLVDNAEGELIKSKLNNQTNVNVNLKYNTFSLDGSLDNGIIAHEYTHGISNRSTGNGYSCLDASKANEQMGEGWSDFFALMLTNKSNATSADARGLGTYASGQPTNGGGIRPSKYSPDFTINSYTYGDTNGMYYSTGSALVVDSHSIGFVWATMLWDLHWKFAEKYGFSNDIANDMNSGSAKVVKVVLEGMKIQGCNPTFISGRDAIIAADNAINNGANKCMIWQTFAKRGLGVNAKPGATRGTLPDAISDQIEDFSVPVECEALATSDSSFSENDISLYPNPAKNEVFIKAKNLKAASNKSNIIIYDFSGKIVDEQLINIGEGESVNTSKLSNGIYVLKGNGIGINFTKKLIIKK